MDKIIAYCRIVFNNCPAFIATQDDIERKKVAEMWSTEEYKVVYEDINCYGCL